jgi:acetolactate synthase-1/2/3 large subunit
MAPIPTGYVHRQRAGTGGEALGVLDRLLAGAERPVVVAGGGVYWDDAAAALRAFAERAGVPVFMNGAGRGTLPTAHPQAFAQARGMALGAADLVLILGAPLDFRLGYGRPPTFAEGAKVVMVDCDPGELGRNRPLELGLTGDIGTILKAALDVVPRTMAARVAPWLAAVRARETESRARLDALCASDDTPISHYRVAGEIARVVGPDTTLVGDGGDVVGCASRIVPLHRPGQWLDPGPLGCLGVGPSFALVAKLLRPGNQVVLIAGDGALGLNGMELETAVRFKLPFVCVVGNDGGWGQIRNPQLSFYGEARAVATSLPATRFDLMAEALGARGALVTRPRDIRPALDKALGSNEVWCINVLLDPAAYRKTGTVSMAI